KKVEVGGRSHVQRIELRQPKPCGSPQHCVVTSHPRVGVRNSLAPCFAAPARYIASLLQETPGPAFNMSVRSNAFREWPQAFAIEITVGEVDPAGDGTVKFRVRRERAFYERQHRDFVPAIDELLEASRGFLRVLSRLGTKSVDGASRPSGTALLAMRGIPAFPC